MRRLLSTLPEALLQHPEVPALEEFLQRLMAERGDEVEFVSCSSQQPKGTGRFKVIWMCSSVWELTTGNGLPTGWESLDIWWAGI